MSAIDITRVPITTVVQKDRCCGCMACVAVCPHAALTVEVDRKGFAHPHVEKSLCVYCGLCCKVCPILPYLANDVGVSEG